MSDKEITEGERKSNGTFIERPANSGRKKGSKNRITLMKLMAEEAYRDGNAERIQQVLTMVVDQALDGDKASQKLIWSSAVSAAGIDDSSNAVEKVVIKIDAVAPEKIVTIIDHDEEE